MTVTSDDGMWSDQGQTVSRSFPVDDLAQRSGRVTCDVCRQDATGRVVDAVMVPFDIEAFVADERGGFYESYAPTAFNRRLEHVQRSKNGLRSVGVFYNHGHDLYGQPNGEASVPLGHPMAIRADTGRGVITSTHYSRDPFADRILNGILDGNIAGQSFTGRIIQSDPNRISRSRSAPPRVRRLEMGLAEYGPTPLAIFEDTPVLATRSQPLGGDAAPAPVAGPTAEQIRAQARRRRAIVLGMLP
jgi:hypothetical protein